MTENKQKFIKAYTRNFSIIMQEAWYEANTKGLIEKLDLKEYPHSPPYIYFMKEGTEEVWENTQANKWLLEKLAEKVNKDETFFTELHKSYMDRLEEIKKWWVNDINDLETLSEFIDLVYEAVSDFVVLYGVLMTDEVPSKFRELADEFRRTDVLFSECNIAITKALKKIYPDLGYLVVYITRDELTNEINREELQKRDLGFAFIPGIVKESLSFSNFSKKFSEFEFEVEQVEEGLTELKGRAAYLGKTKGVVRIVKRVDQAEQVVEGEIIVSPMTTPDFISAMKRSSAFITDEGGITCHAAIVARELKKPCIIGTKIATKVLKDGMEVEVDADNGVVRII